MTSHWLRLIAVVIAVAGTTVWHGCGRGDEEVSSPQAESQDAAPPAVDTSPEPRPGDEVPTIFGEEFTEAEAPAESQRSPAEAETRTSDDQSVWAAFPGALTEKPVRALLLLSVALLVILAVSLVTNVLLLKLRFSRAANTQMSLLPQDVLRDVEVFGGKLDRSLNESRRASGESKESVQAVSEQYSALIKQFLTLRTQFDAKDKEIGELKEGYDFHVYRKFVRPFFELKLCIAEDIEKGTPPTQQTLTQYQQILTDALAQCDLTEFSPTVGESFQGAFGVESDMTVYEDTTDPNKHLTIASVIKPGFKRLCPDKSELVVLPPQVTVFKLKNGDHDG